jgi:hypothetical protein
MGSAMGTLKISGYAGQSIHSFCEWEKYAMPPHRKRMHWQEGRSAFELARLWTPKGGAPAVPPLLTQLLNSHDATRSTVVLRGITEHETPLPPPDVHGPRCHDLTLFAEQGRALITICIEAKADESFGATISGELRKAEKRPGTRLPERLDWLTYSLFGLPAFKDEARKTASDQIRNLPYQLLTAMAGTLLEAENQQSCKAVLVFHEFSTPKTSPQKMKINARELNRFFQFLLLHNGAANEDFALEPDELLGPLPLIERSFDGFRKLPYEIPFFVAKIRTEVKRSYGQWINPTPIADGP